jgi:archaemetzincin
MNILIRISCFLMILVSSCKGIIPEGGKVIVVQPFEDFSPEKANLIYAAIKEVNPNTLLRRSLPLPLMAWYPARDRYRADSLIRYLGRFGTADTILIGLTNKDISTTKGQIRDWGIMGLGYCPGTSCVVSTYRLSPKDRDSQFYKVAIHELGHTQGLPHCKDTTCFMRDAEGGNTLNSEKDFCSSCKRFLRNRGWRL